MDNIPNTSREEDDLERLFVLAPVDLGDGLVEGLVDTFGEVAAARGFEAHQMGVNGIEVFGEIEHLGDVIVAAIAEGDETDFELRRRFAAGDLVADGPDLLLGGVDEAAHAAGRIQAEHDFDLRFQFFLGVVAAGEGEGGRQ